MLTIEMKVFWTEIRFLESDARLLNRDDVNREGLDLSKKGQRAAKLPAVKVGGKKNYIPRPGLKLKPSHRAERQNFFDLYLWQLVALLPFDIPRSRGLSPKAPKLLKELKNNN